MTGDKTPNQRHNNVMELRAIPELLGKWYFIPEYQRGYRWESKQVKRLLDDLLVYFKDKNGKADFYCLQPVVLKECDQDTITDNGLNTLEGTWYEVIDGQQRLTTIRIICSVFDAINGTPGVNTFHIRYSTRSKMDGIYDTLKAQFDPSAKGWGLVIDGPKYANLDSVYIYNAAQTVVKWFNEDLSRKNIFGTYFYQAQGEDKSIQVVWYEDCGKKDARDLFNEINDLTVKLSCSELIRSLFLSMDARYECTLNLGGIEDDVKKKLQAQDKVNRQRYVATKWDEMEHRLSDPRMQAFITHHKPKGLRNNIELLFDLISQKNAGKQVEKRDPLYTFIHFNDDMEKSNASVVWQKVEQYYSRLCGWMEDRDYYHKIGYLSTICGDDSAIIELLDYAERHKKKELNDELDRRIRKSLERRPDVTLSSLSYNNKTDYEYIRKLLFLYSVELNRKMRSQEFFPFELFEKLSDWTLEHIHAQNSECLPQNDSKLWSAWARDNAETLKSLKFSPDHDAERVQLVKELETAAERFDASDEAYTHKTVTALFDKVTMLYNKVDSDKDIQKPKPVHQLSNMALLQLGPNASVGKSAFAVKRIKIIAMRNSGMFFPIGTLNVFQKAYSKNQQLYEWSYRDRRSYMASLKWTLRDYVIMD